MTTTKLLTAYYAATPKQRRRGRAWYDAARKACHEIAADTGVEWERVAAVMAITSPDAKLMQNIAWTRAACENGGGCGRYPADQRPKVYRALYDRADRVSAAVSGPKVTAFYRAILGDADILVIDRWAAFAAGYDRAKPPTKRERAVIEPAYRAAANLVGESVRDFQAIVWIVTRESTPRADGVSVRHFDF
jgi:Ser/Thr protein kinase RdoA (MazF antagonist)